MFGYSHSYGAGKVSIQFLRDYIYSDITGRLNEHLFDFLVAELSKGNPKIAFPIGNKVIYEFWHLTKTTTL